MSLSPIQEAIMWILAEPGSADVQMVVNLLRLKFRDVPSDALIAEVEDAIAGMSTAGLIGFYRLEREPKRERVFIAPNDAEQYISLREMLTWDAIEGYWRWSDRDDSSNQWWLCVPQQVLRAFRDEHGI